MGIEDTNRFRSADEVTPCYVCRYGHGSCPDALMGVICIDYNMISLADGKKMEEEREEKERRIANNLYNGAL